LIEGVKQSHMRRLEDERHAATALAAPLFAFLSVAAGCYPLRPPAQQGPDCSLFEGAFRTTLLTQDRVQALVAEGGAGAQTLSLCLQFDAEGRKFRGLGLSSETRDPEAGDGEAGLAAGLRHGWQEHLVVRKQLLVCPSLFPSLTFLRPICAPTSAASSATTRYR
jgi:hypothetical protein